MSQQDTYISQTGSRSVSINKVLKNTYILLSLTLLFSAAMAGVSMMLNLPHPGIIILLVGFYGLLFAIEKTKNSAMGLVLTFVFTGFLGMVMGPTISYYLSTPNGSSVVMAAMATTGIIFFGLSAYIIVTGKNMAFMGGMLFAGILTAFVLGLVAMIFSIPALSMAVSAIFALLMAGLIMYQTSEIIHGGETNYISATVTLFVSIFNLFQSLLMMFGIFGGDD